MSTRMQEPAELASLQRWLQHAISVEQGVSEDAAARNVRASPHLGALERVGIYRDAYAARLLECLRDDYPALRKLLGRERFASLCRGYVSAHPPRGASLNDYGAQLPEFCARIADPALLGAYRPGLLRDLARIEWASVELIHAPAAAQLTAEQVAARAERFADTRLLPVPAVRLLALERSLHPLYAALRSRRRAAPLPACTERAAFVLLHRTTSWEIASDELSTDEGALLASVLAGATVGSALAAAAERGASEADVRAWFRGWLQRGLFSALA
ncbi:MAG TPA: DNA-binding domain-containing protein [Polyangiales bacterium]|nr:DNA-binding domain-containing protein [Polyangiales bacterium]